MSDYAHPEMLVSTDWVRENNRSAGTVLVEVDVDTSAYDTGHIEGAVGFNWETELQDQVARDIVDKTGFEKLCSDAGISRDDTVILYGDNNNWFAAYALWLFKMYGHDDVRLMNGGRAKWVAENGPLTTDAPSRVATTYAATGPDTTLRAIAPDVLQVARLGNENLVDVRSPDEFSGKVIAPPGMSETAQRGGHVPGAASVPWVTAVADDGTFKSMADLQRIYAVDAGVDSSRPTIAYCRIGERSSHTWFVLKYLLGFDDVRNYDGSWTEYGNLVGAPIERTAPVPVAAG